MSNPDQIHEMFTQYPTIESLLCHLTTADVGKVRMGSNRSIAGEWTGPRMPAMPPLGHPPLNSITIQAQQCCDEILPLVQRQCGRVNRVRWCEKHESINYHGAQSHNVCLQCRTSTNNRLQNHEIMQIRCHRTTLCSVCENEEQRAHPNGINSCVCRSEIQDPYYCEVCRVAALDSIRLRVNARGARLRTTKRDCWGRLVPLRAPAGVRSCRCGRRARRMRIDLAVNANVPAVLCLGCKGTVVRAQAPHGNARRRSPRIRAQLAARMERNRRHDIT